MFKKLKQKINEEQSPQRNAQSPQQAQMGSGERRSNHTPSFHHDGTPSPSDRETSKGVARSPRGSINGDGSVSPQREEPQSFAQKLQLRVPSMESLIRGGASRAENLFRSPSKENLVRSTSRDSLVTPLGESEPLGTPTYDPSSDIESEAEESPGNAESLSKEQLLHRLLRVERSLGKYRAKYSELVTAYRTVQRDKEKTQVILSQSQDKALRRIGELREELQMDQQAKKHLQEEFDVALEEKDQMITVLQTQVALLKKRCKGVSDGALPSEAEVSQSEDAVDSVSAPQSPSKEQGTEPEVTGVEGNADPAKVMEALQKRVKRQENLLQKCKDVMRTHKERSAQLGSENETLQEQLQERLQELEKMKELHTTEKTKLINQLRDAKNLIEQLEQDKGMVIAETKRQMHETLEMKEEEVAQLRSRLQQATSQKEELQEQKEKAEKSAFEELERALGIAQRAEEARKQLQVQLEEQMKEMERTSEEERKMLQKKLTQVKQEALAIMKKSSEDTLNNMEKVHSEVLAAKEEETCARINKAVEQCKEEFAQLTKEREQQASLALEDAELQKTAVRTDAENRVKEIQMELEAAKTRILELESSLVKSSQDGSVLSHEFSGQLEELKDKHKEQISALEEKHQEQLEKHKGTLIQLHAAALEELEEKHRVEVETIVKDKELQFQAHVEDINQKTLEKLDARQSELESLSYELSEALKSKQLLEEKLMAIEDVHSSAQKAHEQRFEDQLAKHNAEVENIKREHEQSLGGMEKTLKEELNALKIVLREKERVLEENLLIEKTLKGESDSAQQELNLKVKELEELSQSLSRSQSENKSLKQSHEQLNKITVELGQCKSELTDLEHQLEVAKNERKQKEESLQKVEQQLQQTKKELSEQEKTYTVELNMKQEEQTCLKKRLDDEKAAHEKKMKNIVKDLEAKLKAQETKMEKFKQKSKEMQEIFKKNLQEKEEIMKNELAKKDTELQQKDKQVQEKILEMAQKNSEGFSSAMSELQINHKDELEKLYDTHKHEIEELERCWKEKLGQQEEDIIEKHSQMIQEKAQELEEVSQQLRRSREENEHVLCEIKKLKEELAIRETTVQKLQAELKEAAVKIESLSQGEALLKEQMESVERNLNQALNERNALQDKMSTTEEENKEKLKTLSEKLEETEVQLKALEASRCKDGEDLQKKFEESIIQMKSKEAEFQKHLGMINNQMEHYCKEFQSKMECGTNELCQRVDCRVKELQDRIFCNQKKVGHLKNIILTKVDRICTLEESLHQQTEENKNLCSSLEQTTAQVNAHAEHIKALTNERESLSQAASEKGLKIEVLIEESKKISESATTKALHIGELENIISDLKNQLAGSITEKEEAITKLNQLYQEEKQQAVGQMEETIERLEQERRSAEEQANGLRNSLSEAESKCSQNYNTITSLQTRLEEMERVLSEKNEALQRLTASIDNQSISKSEMDQILSEKEQKVSGLTLELESCNRRIYELQEQVALKTNECEQLTSDLKHQHSVRENEKREFIEQLQQTQLQCTQSRNLEQGMVAKLHSLEKDNQKCKVELESQKEEFERMKDEIIKSKEESLKATEEKLSTESARKVSELKKKAEQKISQIRKQLTSEVEEKEQTIKALQTSLEEIKNNETSSKNHIQTLEEKAKTLEEAIVKLKGEQEKQVEQILSQERLEKEKSLKELKTMYEEKLSALERETVHQESKTSKNESVLQEIEVKLKEAEEQNRKLLTEISHLKEEILEKEEKLVQNQAAMNEFQNPVKVQEHVTVEHNVKQTKSMLENHSEEVDSDSLEFFKNKLMEVKSEKEKIQKDFTRLQKDMRSLRKEHEQELEYMKKELAEENDKKLKFEMEEMEMKHNSTMKQILREFNTEMALKEKELDTAVKETIAKAQSVETELISCHREEASQLRKVIAQKEDDLHRTVQKYEQVLQSREEEMGGRVWQVQKELEELQARTHGNSEMGTEELQAQLAEKTSLLSEARLKEQGFVERIHSLEDKIKFLHRSTVVTHLGSTFRDPGYNSDALSEPTEMEYLRKVLFEYMMGRETKTMAKVITSMLKFPPDQVQKVLDKEDSKPIPWLRFFGYSVLEHYHDNTRWVLVGAPRANSTYSSSVHSPGAVYKCRVHSNPERRCTEMDMGRGNKLRESCGKTCQGDRDDEWMGVSLARQDKANGRILACAHRWKNVYYDSEHILPHGYCSIIPPTLQGRTWPLIPCYEDYKQKYGEEHGSCQAGIAGVFTEELVVMGAPGSYYWTGTIKVYNLTSDTFYSPNKEEVDSHRYSYLGYAVTAGHFSSPNVIDIAAGAPQHSGCGKVYIFKIDGVSLVKSFQASGKMMGSYFGSSLCAVDLNQDGLSDLLVGAPMHSQLRDEGQVSVYLSKGNGVMEEAGLLTGDNAYNAHFGECITSIGDIDDDGYQDVAIGAPKEDDYAGAVYIYHGDAAGIISKYSMRLSGRSVNPGLQMFGQSISGNVDMDGNGYADVTIGAFMADSVVLLRSRPVITVDVSIFLPVSINISVPQCHESQHNLNCFNVTVCMRFCGRQVPGQIELLYNLIVDVDKRQKSQPSRIYFSQNGAQISLLSHQLSLDINREECQRYTAYVKKDVKDVFTAITFEVAYSLGKHVLTGHQERDLPALSPVLRWRKGDKIAARNETWFEKNCLSDDCAADLRLHGKLLLSGMHVKPHLALGGVKNISLNLTISNAGDDAYDTNIYFNFTREVFYINFWQKEEKGISCVLVDLDFLKCSVGFPFMRAQTKYHFAVIFDTSQLSGENDILQFLIQAKSANPEHKLADNSLDLSIPLVHETDTTITGVVTPSSFVYGNSIDASLFVQLEDMECNFQPLNLTFQAINNGPSRLPGSTVDIRIPNRLAGSGADMFHIVDTQVADGRGNCTPHRNPTPCTIPQDRESIFHSIFAFFTKSGRRVLDCDRPGRACMTISCTLGPQLKEEALSIDIKLLLNTEILKKDSSSVIQFVARGNVQVDNRAMEGKNGLPEDIAVSTSIGAPCNSIY
ncbi:hypothetical protein LDENG_00001480 [Lucifuga dentata]|nr:hypothetical protein LDENG_00001480 [Lucifuga dentata]